MKQQSSFVGWDFDGDPPIWKIQENITYPHLFWEPNAVTPPQPQYTGGTGTTDDPYQISNVADLQLLMASPADWNKYFIQTADINMQGIEMTPVGNDVNNFTGSFDGQSYIISNVYINMSGSNNVGLFGYVGSGGQIRNLGVENVNLTGNNYVGGLVGYNDGSISNCYSTGLVSSDAYSSYVGGLVGYSDGNISDCYSTSAVTAGMTQYLGGLWDITTAVSAIAIRRVWSAAIRTSAAWWDTAMAISAIAIRQAPSLRVYSDYLGGLVGQFSYGDISNCYSTGTVTGGDNSYFLGGLVGLNYIGSISDCYSTGVVTGGDNSYYLGGLVGYSESRNNISNCYSTGAVTGGVYSTISAGWWDTTTTAVSAIAIRRVRSAVLLVLLLSAGWWGTTTTAAISNCYFLITSGPNDGNGVPLTDAQMKQQSNFVGWDFNNVWHICETTNYPKLIWQMLPGDFVCPDGVNFADYSFFAERWMNTDCASNDNCDGADFDFSGTVDIADLAILCDYWLKGF